MKKKYKKQSTEKAVEKGTGTLARTIKKTRPKVKKKQIKVINGYKKYTVYERREDILKRIIKAGHPRAISQYELSKEYDVSQVMIHKDIKAISAQIKKELPKEAEFITHVVFQSAIKSLMKGDNSDKFKAAKLINDWNDWLFDMGKQKRAPKEHILDANITQGVIINIIQPNNANKQLATNQKIIDCPPPVPQKGGE